MTAWHRSSNSRLTFFHRPVSGRADMVGKTVSRYRILELLGSGGMGEVYLAWDTDLERKVALKFLSRAHEPEALARFRREARATASLNHPNIVTVYEIGQHEDNAFIAMEFVEGRSLRAVMNSRLGGKSPWTEVVEYGCQVCRGLSEAHQAGIIHRDIKPENILINSRGVLKVADFGLAAIKGATKLTRDTSTPGTLSYMSPEQLQGHAVDTRSDIFSVGVVLYEMLAGRQPFAADHEAAVAYQITHTDPAPLQRFNTGAPEPLLTAVRRSLTKDPAARYQDIAELLRDLEGARGRKARLRVARSGLSHRARSLAALVGIVLTAVAAWFVMSAVRRDAPPPTAVTYRQLTFDGDVCLSAGGDPSVAAISPDGQFVVYAVTRDSTFTVLVQDLAGGNPIQIQEGLTGVWPMRWSPDGTKIALTATKEDRSVAQTMIMSRLGGELRHLPPIFSACWSPDGTKLAGAPIARKYVTLHDAVTADSVGAVHLDGEFNFIGSIDWSPTGNRLVVLTSEKGNYECVIHTIGVDGSQHQAVAEHYSLRSPKWSSDGSAVYYLRQTDDKQVDLMKVRVSRVNGAAEGEPEVLQSGVDAGGFTLSSDNRKMCYTKVLVFAHLWDVAGYNGETVTGNTHRLTRGTSRSLFPTFSPDGTTLAFSHNGQLCLMPYSGGDMRQLTFLSSPVANPRWSPDSKMVAFVSEGKVWRVPSGGGAPRAFAGTQAGGDLVWAPGREILYQRPGSQVYHALDPMRETERFIFGDSLGWCFLPRVSPEARHAAVWWNRKDGRIGLWIVSLTGDEPNRLLQKSMAPIAWSQDGREIYAAGPEDTTRVYRVPIAGGDRKTVAVLPAGQLAGVDVTADGRHIVCSIVERIQDVWLLEGFDSSIP